MVGIDVVGEFKSAEIGAFHMLSGKAKKTGKLTQEKVLLELWSRFANNIGIRVISGHSDHHPVK